MNLKKPKFWDYKQPNIYAYLLSPIALLIKILNNLKIKPKKKKLNIKTICVGNLYIGGTGKTSLSIKINKILNEKKIKSCFVKKFYKNQIDEQNILKSKGKLYLSTSRFNSIIEAENEGYKVAILDDGLQDCSINHDISIVCFNNINWIGNGMTIPAGPLREELSKLKNYKHLFLNGNLENIENLKEKIFTINPEITIHLGKYEAINLNEFNKKDNFLVFSGIGNHQTFINMLKNYELNIVKEIEFADHYKYNLNDINHILNEANKLKCKIITTEKDYFRLAEFKPEKIKYVKSEIKIIDEEKFIKSII